MSNNAGLKCNYETKDDMKIASFCHTRLNQLVKPSGHTEYSFLSADKSQSNCSRTHGLMDTTFSRNVRNRLRIEAASDTRKTKTSKLAKSIRITPIKSLLKRNFQESCNFLREMESKHPRLASDLLLVPCFLSP